MKTKLNMKKIEKYFGEVEDLSIHLDKLMELDI
jgi:hypothetical protein